MFERFASLTRFSHGWTITEKLDGTNAQIYIVRKDEPPEDALAQACAWVGDLLMFAGSRNKLLTTDSDNAGFARFAVDNHVELVETLGEGRHFGEWVGKGINKRQYGLPDKRFALFNTARWTGVELPERVTVVPVLFDGYANNPGEVAVSVMNNLKTFGSSFAPGFMDPEGIVMRHGPSGTLFKKTFDYDEQGKWAENEARRNGS